MTKLTTHVSYDDVPYEGGIVGGTHPEHLATMARLFGIDAAPPEKCRVLEIGCATGANLLPMGHGLPGSTFLGIDPSLRQIEMGRRILAEYGVTNVQLEAVDVRDIVESGREFDYIICHGVFSWVSEGVQEAIFAASRRLLAPNGVAYISYNTLPGFHWRAAVREMVRFHGWSFSDDIERARQARALLAFLIKANEAFPPDSRMGTYATMLKTEQRLIEGLPDSYILHEHLVEHNQAFYFYEFMERADKHRLQYLGDVDFETMMVNDLPPDVAETLNSIAPSQVQLEQYKDFVTNRTFRRTLLCRDDTTVERHISPATVASFDVRLTIRRSDDGWRLARAGGLAIAVTDRSVLAVIDVLEAAAPLPLSFGAIEEAVAARAPVEADWSPPKGDHLSAILLSLYAHDAVEFRTWTPPMAPTVPERPEAFMPARRVPRNRNSVVPHPLHGTVDIHPFMRSLIALVDGTRTETELVDEVQAGILAGEFDVPELEFEDTPTREVLAGLIHGALEDFRRNGLLVLPPSAPADRS